MKLSHFLIPVVVLVAACGKEREAPNGIKVKVYREGEGAYAKSGELLVTNVVLKDEKDSIWRDSRGLPYPAIFPVGEASEIDKETGIESTFRVMRKGDSLSITVDARTLYKDQPMPSNIKPDQEFTLYISIIEITDQRGMFELQKQYQTRFNAQREKMALEQLAKDTLAIDRWLDSKAIKATRDQSGLRYVVTQPGNAERPALTNTVVVKYRGWYLDNGEEFDRSDVAVQYRLSDLIRGWQIGFQYLGKGGKAIFYVPSGLAYGAAGRRQIPPNAILFFEVELVDFRE